MIFCGSKCISSHHTIANLPNSNSSGSFGFNVKRVKSLYKVASTSKFSAERENTGKHWARTSPHMRITTNNSRILFNATMSLLMSYCREEINKWVSLCAIQNNMIVIFGVYVHRNCDWFRSCHDCLEVLLKCLVLNRQPIESTVAGFEVLTLPQKILLLPDS